MADRDILPCSFKPRHYTLSLGNIDFEKWTYRGNIIIELEIIQTTNQLVLNAHELKIFKAIMRPDHDKGLLPFVTSNFEYDIKARRVIISFHEDLPLSQKASFELEFEGVINNEMAGFYRSKYKPARIPASSTPHDNEWHYMLSTQFEPCDARRAFPCFDEPNLKATFDFQIEVPVDQVALSNMPVKKTKPIRYGWNMVSFERTPVMSSYLLAWAVGDFGYIEACTDRQHNGRYIPVRVYTTSGLEEQGRLALKYAIKTISLFSELFKIDYPLPKADLIAVHETTAAVEHWGLITFYTNQLLFENETSDFRSKSDIAYGVAHELAHQWFGNLVTMDWWDDLWLNEGFATWVGWYAVHCMHPEWEIWVQFVTDHMEKAFLLDGLRASHPIHIPIRDALETDQLFDDISYSKACAVIRMFVDHLGIDTFLSGISIYLKAHAYGNADTKRLWEVLGEVSGQDMNNIVYSWIHKAGYPVLTVTEESSQISVKQSRFLSTGDMRPEDDSTIWCLPLSIEGKTAEAGTAHILYNTKDQVIDVDESFYKLNTGATGFYRVNYPASRLAKFTQQLDRLDTQERIFIVSSVASLVFGGYHNIAALLTLLQGFFKESHPLVWRQVFSTINSIESVFSEDMTIRKGLKKFVLNLIDEKVRMIDWNFPENEDHLNASLRAQLIEQAVANDHPEVHKEALRRFEAWEENPDAHPISPPIRWAVLVSGVDNNPIHAVELLKKEYYATESFDVKETCLRVLAWVTDTELLKVAIIPFNFNTCPPSNAVLSSDMHTLGLGLASNVMGRPLHLQYFKDHWEEVLSKLGNPISLNRYIDYSLSEFTDESIIDDMNAFFKTKDTRQFQQTLDTVRDKIRARAVFKKRDTSSLKQWLTTNGYI